MDRLKPAQLKSNREDVIGVRLNEGFHKKNIFPFRKVVVEKAVAPEERWEKAKLRRRNLIQKTTVLIVHTANCTANREENTVTVRTATKEASLESERIATEGSTEISLGKRKWL